MKNQKLLLFTFLFYILNSFAQGPEITSWLQNTTETGSYYNNGSPNTISNGILVNCLQVEYSNNFVYVTTEGVPSYPKGPFLDGNPSQAQAQGSI